MPSIKREVLLAKNREYLASLKEGNPNEDLRSEIIGAVFDSLADAVLVFDSNQRVVLANETAVRLSGWSLENVTREEFREHFKFFVDERNEIRLPLDEEPLEIAMREKRSALREAYVKSESLPDGGRWVRAHAAPTLDDRDKVVGGVTVFQDITEEVRAQFQRDCLMSLIAHDLKNHLASWDIMMKLIEGLLPGELTDKFRDIAASVQESNERYRTMTESLLEISRSQFFAGPVHAAPVDLHAALKDAVKATSSIAARKNVTVRLTVSDDTPYALGLEAPIQQVFTNVILNSVEASNEGGEVSIKAFPTSSGRARILIIDKGPGIPAEQLDALFDPHRVASHRKMTSHSTGFGLYLTAMLVESQNGTVFCRSEVGEGTTFGIEFPAAAP